MNRIENSFENKAFEAEKLAAQKSQSTKKTVKTKIIMNVADTQYPVVKQVGKKLKWSLCTEPIMNLNFDLCWTDNHVRPQTFAKMQDHQKINHFPGMAILSRKNNLGRNLMNFARNFPNEYNFFPITWNLPNDYAELKEYHENRKQGKAQTFIVKPQAGCQGRGIYLTRNIDKLKFQRCVVQRYMHKPFLIDGLKFDLRIYVLLAGIDPFRIFVYEEGLARFATEPYCPPRTDNLDNKYMHLTNYAINKDHPNFIFNESIQNCDVGHKRSLTSFYKLLEKQGHDVVELKRKINDIFVKTLITGYPTLSRSLHQSHPDNFANNMCFEILGFDVMLDHHLNPYLLEINYTPSFTTDTPLDLHIKSNLISDTISLLNITPQWKNQMRAHKRAQVQERMVTGKKKKYQEDEKIKLIQEAARERDEYQQKNMNNFTKIFINNRTFEQYIPYYEFAQELYQQQHKDSNNFTSATYHPLYKYYTEDPTKPKIKENSKINQNQNQNQKNRSTIINSSLVHTNTSIVVERQKRQEGKNKRNISSAKPSKNASQEPTENKDLNKHSAKLILISEKQINKQPYFEDNIFTNDRIKAKYQNKNTKPENDRKQ